ncbi:hypothetical protein GOB93_10235 [Acetobacter musti]|uniref:Uncharacterized protein n=1 Tax=Acetobacter musti TaxID=864732 RepID=A0ABX0JQG5_9PROT|nr:hypothetical protein [Acetobacter musti]NHN85018.1 hypothetical protein [Acetobacter musti]
MLTGMSGDCTGSGYFNVGVVCAATPGIFSLSHEPERLFQNPFHKISFKSQRNFGEAFLKASEDAAFLEKGST